MHNIAKTNDGRDAIAYAGETPWHKLGQKLENAFDAKTALEQGGLDFTVEKTPLATADDGCVIPDKFAVRRTDNKNVLGLCTGFYQPLQNRDAFAFFDGIFGKDAARFEVAGALGQGERVWMLAKLPGEFRVTNDDVVGKWLLLTNGHDTSEPVRARFTPIRVVCQNTLNAALRGKQNEVRVQHIGNVKGKLELAAKLLKAAGIYFQDVEDAFRGFIKRGLKEKEVRAYVTESIAGAEVAPEELTRFQARAIDRVLDIHDTGRGHDLKGVRGTLWGAYNAVTEYVDHDKGADNLRYMGFGAGAELKTRAFDVAQKLAIAAN